MRGSFITLATAFLAFAITAKSAQLPLYNQDQHRAKVDPSFPQPGSLGSTGPAHGLDSADVGVGSGGGANLADTLTLERRAGLWWDYARDISTVTTRLLASGSTRSTLFVPVDTAIYKMARKPHQNADGSPVTDEQAKLNVERFISAHIVPDNVDLPTTSSVQTLLEGLSIQVEQDGDGWKVQPGDIAVVGIKEASNGRILYLDRVIDY